MSERVNVYIENTHSSDGIYHAIQDMGHRRPRTKCGKPIGWTQYTAILPLEWALSFGTQCKDCTNVIIGEVTE